MQDVEPDTFSLFAQYVYTGAYRVKDKEDSTVEATIKATTNKIGTSYYCRICGFMSLAGAYGTLYAPQTAMLLSKTEKDMATGVGTASNAERRSTEQQTLPDVEYRGHAKTDFDSQNVLRALRVSILI